MSGMLNWTTEVNLGDLLTPSWISSLIGPGAGREDFLGLPLCLPFPIFLEGSLSGLSSGGAKLGGAISCSSALRNAGLSSLT